MGKKLYVGNLPFTVTEDALRQMFADCGTVESAKIITDKFSGRSKGFGFVEMSSDAEAATAITKFNGMEHEGRKLNVNEARPPEPRTGGGGRGDRGPSGDGGGGGGRVRW